MAERKREGKIGGTSYIVTKKGKGLAEGVASTQKATRKVVTEHRVRESNLPGRGPYKERTTKQTRQGTLPGGTKYTAGRTDSDRWDQHSKTTVTRKPGARTSQMKDTFRSPAQGRDKPAVKKSQINNKTGQWKSIPTRHKRPKKK